MTQRQRPEPDGPLRTGLERRGERTMPDVGLRTGHETGKMLRGRGAVEACGVYGREIRHLLGRRRFEVRRDREQVVEARRIEESDLRATLRSLADAVREHGRLAAQVRTDDEQRVEGV